MAGLGWYFMDHQEVDAVKTVAESKSLSRYRFDEPGASTYTEALEEQFSKYFNSPYAIGMNSCTSALYTALLTLGIGPGDEVVVPAYTFIATVSAVIHTGAKPVIADIDASLGLCPTSLKEKISNNTKAIIAVHMLGESCDIFRITEVANEHGIPVIEDVAQAVGGCAGENALGSIGKIGCFSFNKYKNISAGDGGMLITSDQEIATRAYEIHDQGYGKTNSGVLHRGVFGLNLKITELTSAVALCQLKKLSSALEVTYRLRQILEKLIDLRPGVVFRKRHFSSGGCNTSLVLQFSTKREAAEFADALGTVSLAESPLHSYMGWPIGIKPVLKANDILSKSVGISIGTCDGYIGLGFGINPLSTEDEIRLTASKINTALSGN